MQWCACPMQTETDLSPRFLRTISSSLDVIPISYYYDLTMDGEDDTGGDSQSNSNSIKTIILRTKEDVAKELKEWMKIEISQTLHIEKKSGEPLGTDSDDGGTKKLYDNAIEHIESKLDRPLSCLETTWTERQYVITLLQLWLKKSLGKAFEYLNDEKNDVSQLSTVLSQLNSINSFEDMDTCSIQLNDAESPLFNWFDGDYRYLQLILEQDFDVNEDKNLKEILDKDEFVVHYVKDEKKTGQDIIKQLAEKFSRSSETEQGGTVAAKPEWLQTFLSNTNSIIDDEWTPKLQFLTKQICKKFLLPEIQIQFKEENGKQIISIEGVVIFVSKVIKKMIELKVQHSGVEEIEIIALQSVHIDCDLDNGTWHGINIGMVTDKLIVDDEVNDGSFCWNVSGEKAKNLKRKPDERGESGGNVHVVCNQIINGEKWTIVADGGDGSAKWTKEEFQKSFPSMITDEANIKTVLTTLQEILPKENRSIGRDISPEHTGNFIVRGRLEDDSFITVIFYKGKKTKQTLISIEGGITVVRGGYGGDIAMEFFSNDEINTTPDGVPFTGSKNQTPLTADRYEVYEASGSNGNIGKRAGDVAFIHKNADGKNGEFYGFEKDETIRIELHVEEPKQNDTYVKYEDVKHKKCYAVLKKHSESLYKGSRIVSATKKKSVIRQSLVRHLDQINEWNQLTKNIEMMQSNLKEQQSNNIDEIINEMDNKVRQSHKFMTQQQRQQHQTLEKVQYVKPAKDSSPHSVDKPEIIGRRPVYYPTPTNKEIENIFCLDVLPTEDGNDSLLHCLFGQVNSNGKYECIDTERLCKQIAKYIREKCCDWETYNAVIMFVLRVKDDERFPIAKTEGKKLIDFIMEKHPQLKGTETEMSRWLNQNDDVENEPTKIIDKWKSIWKRNPQIIKYLKEDKNCGKFKILKEECAKYIESFFGFRSTALGLFELGTLLANMFKLTIHVFKEHVSSSYFQHIETHKVDSNDDSRREEHFILYEDFFTLKENDNKNEMNFEKLKKWISENQEITNKNCIDKFNPKCNKSPDKLSQLVLDWIKPNMDIDEVKQLEKAISLLAKWVDYYNSRNVSPFFYLTIVGKCPQPQELELDFLVLEMETRLNKPDSEMPLTTRENWRKSVRDSLKTHDQALLSLLTQIVMKTRENDFLFSFDLEKLLRMLNVLKQLEIDWSFLDKKDIDSLSIINLFYKNRGTFWWEKVDKWLTNKTNNRLIEENQPEYVNLLLELEYKNQQKLLQDFTNNSAEAIGCLVRTTRGQKCKRETRTVEDIFKEMNRKDIETNLYRTKDEEMGAVYKIRGEIKNLICDRQIKNTTPLADFLCVFDYAVELIMGFELRDTQRVALMTLLERGEKTLAQVKTGEGKSIIVAGLAIGHALMYKENSTVDVITSNDILAIRDSSLSVAEGGLKELYEFFNVTVANNCSQSIDERKRAYNKDIVYGQLANFQRDYLLDTFYNRNIRGDRPMNFVIIDEADCMLLDRGNDVLYLSHDIPGMEMLESLYVFIWEKIQKIQTVIIGDEELELIKSAILYDLHGQIKREDLKNIQNNLLGQEESALERTALWDHLIREKVIDPKGRLLIHDVNEITENKMNYSVNIGLDSKLKFYFRKIAERERRIRIPNHLSDFVDRNLDTWLDNARRALQLKQDEDYVIDCDRSDTSPDFNLQVIVIDPETGTDQFNSQWDGALHQFLQLKEGCKLTMQSLKAIFISNAKYINFYVYLVGVSGTLGSRTGKIFLKNTYKCDCFTIPTAFPKIFLLKPAKLLKTKESWLTAITKETQRTIVKENRSIVIFCQSIKQVNQVHQHLKSKIPDIIKDPNNKRIHRYTRDYEKFQFEKEPGLDIGNVIVTTNLAGRGTDIKLSETLKANGGLHICLTYFPENERVEEQAMGRAARKGEPGSGILILWEPQIGKDSRADEEWGAEKIFVMKEERAWKEKQRISQIEKDFKHTESFNSDRNVLAEKSVMEQVEKLKKEKTIENEMIQLLDDKALLKFIQGNKLDKWALWLDESDYNFKYFNLNPFFQFENSISADFFTSSTPARKIAIFKCLATTKNKGTRQIDQKEKAKNILNELIHSPENVFYPAAFYYYAFVRLKEGNLDKNGKEEFIRSLRSAETILSEHIDMQISFSLNHQSDKKLADPSFCDVDGYREQKENNIKILQCFISSIQSLLGAHYLTASDIEEKLAELKNKKENAQKSKELIKTQTYMKADKLFKWLMKSKYIECKVNDPDTVPNYNDVIQEIANEYDVKRSTLEKKLSTI
uniref:Uncharacterized protein n=1 Tax=Daphnia galeata TaxID=27404 RepID=A0A8J2RF48_9CRUS|nr:unnamed protein product [Daphnia galeata]